MTFQVLQPNSVNKHYRGCHTFISLYFSFACTTMHGYADRLILSTMFRLIFIAVCLLTFLCFVPLSSSTLATLSTCCECQSVMNSTTEATNRFATNKLSKQNLLTRVSPMNLRHRDRSVHIERACSSAGTRKNQTGFLFTVGLISAE